MVKFYSKGYVCYLRASQMNDLIEKSAYDERKRGVLKKIASAYETIQSELESSRSVVITGRWIFLFMIVTLKRCCVISEIVISLLLLRLRI